MLSTLRFESKDVTRVEETWKQFVPSAILQNVDPRRFRFEWLSAELEDMTVVEYELAAEVRSVVEPEDQLLVCRVQSDRVDLGSGHVGIDAGHPWLTDGRQVWGRWEDDAKVRALIFDRTTAQTLARRMSGNDAYRVRVKGLAPTDQGAAEQWERSFAYLGASFAHAGAEDELILAGLRRHALWVTLTSFDTGFREALEGAVQLRPATTTVRRAIDYIDENAHRAITIDDIAGAVHMSTRGLQYAFRRSLDTTPAEQLRRARLDGAHRELLHGRATTVGQVARRWGFAHPSRFAAAYRAAYGVAPSDTLRRGKGD
ncbi:helix-turn-helix transcriptional regulator [Microbacterium abyssi]|uniref:helix-turn-helix transcriptional regulator n=1 Tax=Microbacterium abyssi TaxID=2782166 RepID=UPI001E32CDA7|nr:AraC family transcriptional regulator [Microbacterium sp. A18JL241]